MKIEIERLWAEKDEIIEQIKSLEEKMDLIYKQIEDFQSKCSHSTLNTTKTKINIGGEDFNLTIDKCEECGETFLK